MRLTRFWNLLIIVLAQYFTAIFLIGEGEGWKPYVLDFRLFLLCFSTVILAASGYIINDYYDVKIDYVNKPERVIVGKVLKRRVVMIYHTVLNFTGIAIGAYLSWAVGLIHLLSAILLWFYSNQLKRMPFIGNFAVAALTGMSIFIVGLIYVKPLGLVILYSVFAFAFTLFREVIKDMEDLKGDATFGCKTLPIIWGLRKTKSFLYGLKGGFLLLMVVLVDLYLGAEAIGFSIVLLISLALISYRIYRTDTVRGFRQLSNIYKMVMLLGILSMLIV